MHKFTLIAFLFFGLVLPVSASDSPNPKELSDSFFKTLIGGSGAKAVDQFFTGNPLISQKKQQLQLLKSQLGTVSQIYGPAFAYESVSIERLTPSLERHVYITKHEYHPITWEMYFYKPKDTWIPDQLLFVDQYQKIGAKK